MTTSRIPNALLLIVLATGALTVLFLRSRPLALDGTISTQGVTVQVSVADTEREREQGLSGTKRLPEGVGKLFVFDTPALYGFWMKNMRYPIDIVWIDDAWQVAGITRDVAPETYPSVFYPPKPVVYVLELPSGSAFVDKLALGEKLTWNAR
jgi:uncharacterized membrane protein (UPF0127 family)